jgi:hypothetical protein
VSGHGGLTTVNKRGSSGGAVSSLGPASAVAASLAPGAVAGVGRRGSSISFQLAIKPPRGRGALHCRFGRYPRIGTAARNSILHQFFFGLLAAALRDLKLKQARSAGIASPSAASVIALSSAGLSGCGCSRSCQLRMRFPVAARRRVETLLWSIPHQCRSPTTAAWNRMPTIYRMARNLSSAPMRARLAIANVLPQRRRTDT